MSDWMNEWLTEGGLDGEMVTVRNVAFATDPEFRDGQQVFLSVDFVPDDPDTTPMEGQRIGCGAGWEIADDDGTKIVREDGRKGAFNTKSKAGRFLKSLLESDAFNKALADKHKAGEQVTPFDAAFYEGVRGVATRNTDSFETRDEGGAEETVEFSFWTLTDIEGYESGGGSGGGKAKKAAAKKPADEGEAPAKKAAAKKATAKKAAAKKDDAGLEEQVREHCKNTEHETHDDWMMAVYTDIPDVAEDEDVQAKIDDPDGIWAEVWG